MSTSLRPPIAVVLAFAVLGVAWAMTGAPFSAPDESQHYIRALGIRTDERLAGPRVRYTGPVKTPDGRWVAPDPSIPDTKGTIWRRKLTRGATVPAGLSPAGFECMTFSADASAACTEAVRTSGRDRLVDTDVGSYPPFPYLFPAVATALGDSPPTADRWGRLSMLAVWLVLLATAVFALWDRRSGSISLVGLLVAITPVAVFVGASINNSGTEIMAAIAFNAVLIRLARNNAGSTRDFFTLAAATGCVLILSRSLSLVWVITAVVVAAVLAGRERLVQLARSARKPLLGASAVVVTGGLLALLWERAYGPSSELSLVPGPAAIKDGVSQLRGTIETVVSGYGHGEVQLAGVAVFVWFAVTAAVIVGGLALGSSRERLAVAAAGAFAVGIPVYVYAALMRNEGIETQGRHLLPVMVTVPLVAGEVIRRHRDRTRWTDWLFPAVALLTGVVQVLAWWTNSKRYAVGADGSWWFLSDPEWSPPLGWTIWVLLVALTAALLIGLAVRGAVSRGRPQHRVGV